MTRNNKPGVRANEQTGPDTTEHFASNYTYSSIAARIKSHAAQYHHNVAPCFCRSTGTCTTCLYWAKLIQIVEQRHGQAGAAS